MWLERLIDKATPDTMILIVASVAVIGLFSWCLANY